MRYLRRCVVFLLAFFGYRLEATGLGYADARQLLRCARRSGKTLCEYLEERDGDPKKIGRRDGIVEKLDGMFSFLQSRRVCEIGAGTGMFLEKFFVRSSPEVYEVYETNPGWRRYLKKEFGRRLTIHVADGCTLSASCDYSFDLVHAHGVFVYLPLLVGCGYIKEAGRTLQKGGRLVFDCYVDDGFDSRVVEAWLRTQWRFPVVFPRQLLFEVCEDCGLRVDGEFSVAHGAGFSTYLVFIKS